MLLPQYKKSTAAAALAAALRGRTYYYSDEQIPHLIMLSLLYKASALHTVPIYFAYYGHTRSSGGHQPRRSRTPKDSRILEYSEYQMQRYNTRRSVHCKYNLVGLVQTELNIKQQQKTLAETKY